MYFTCKQSPSFAISKHPIFFSYSCVLLNNPVSKYYYYGNRTRKAFSITTTTCFTSTPYIHLQPLLFSSAFVSFSALHACTTAARLKLRFKSVNPFEDHHSIPHEAECGCNNRAPYTNRYKAQLGEKYKLIYPKKI